MMTPQNYNTKFHKLHQITGLVEREVKRVNLGSISYSEHVGQIYGT